MLRRIERTKEISSARASGALADLADLDINALLAFHKAHGKIATVSGTT